MILSGLESYGTSAQNSALVNEFKGNLFEYLVASAIAKYYGLESDFITSITDSFRQSLSFYETWLRTHDLPLLRSLMPMAKDTARYFIDQQNLKIKKIALVGKIAAGSGDDQFSEADLVLTDDQDQLIFLSVKLCKANAFVNTKSGGIKTFIAKYFSCFESANRDQQQLNQKVDFFFEMMGEKLYELAELEWRGSFDSQWSDRNLPQLPGMLEPAMNQVLLSFYSQVIEQVHQILLSYYQADASRFSQCLLPLVGFSDPRMQVLSCFHNLSTSGAQGIDHLSLEKIDFVDLKELSFADLKSGISSFELQFTKHLLQIRVKPMNKFTTPGLKVNCSTKRCSRGDQ